MPKIDFSWCKEMEETEELMTEWYHSLSWWGKWRLVHNYSWGFIFGHMIRPLYFDHVRRIPQFRTWLQLQTYLKEKQVEN